MLSNVTGLERLHVPGKYMDTRMQHTCSRHAAWDPHSLPPELEAPGHTCEFQMQAWISFCTGVPC